MIQNKKEFIEKIVNAINPNQLINHKHDPNSEENQHPSSKGKSIISLNFSGSLKTFIESGDYKVFHYLNNNYRYINNPYYLIVPNDESLITGYWINKGETFNVENISQFESHDSLVIVSGSNYGWHGFTENLKEIELKEKNKKLALLSIY